MTRLFALLALFLSLGLLGCEASELPASDIRPEPAAQVAPAAPEAAEAAPVAPSAEVKPTAPGSNSGSCCGSPSCQRAAAAAGAGEGEGCGCRRGLPPEVAAQVNCGG